MNIFNLPSNSIINKEVPILTIDKKVKLSSRKDHYDPLITSYIKSCYLYAVLKDDAVKVTSTKNKDAYYNEILFLSVDINDISKSKKIIKHLLRIFHYQTVIVLKNLNDYCIATGLVRDAKRIAGSRKIVDYAISSWMRKEVLSEKKGFDIQKMNMSSYESIYLSIHQTVSDVCDKYLPLTFVSELYAYTHGLELDLSERIALNERLKKMCPDNLVTTKTGSERYLFSENEAYQVIMSSYGYPGARVISLYEDCLIETLWNFIEYEDDFNLEIPKSLQVKINDYNDEYWATFNEHKDDNSESKYIYDEDENQYRPDDISIESWINSLLDEEEYEEDTNNDS